MAFDYFQSCRKKKDNIPVYEKNSQYAEEENLKVDTDTYAFSECRKICSINIKS
jgi:hypothetical protein